MGKKLPLTYLSLDDLRRKAKAFLDRFHPGATIPVPIEEIVDLQFGVDIVPVPNLRGLLEIDAFVTSDLETIFVDAYVYEKFPTRYRFSLAHEIAHAVLHPKVFRHLAFQSIAEWQAVMSSIPEEDYRWLEWQAYALAGLILVPPEPLAIEFERARLKAIHAGFHEPLADVAIRAIEGYVAERFNVSREVVHRRVEKDGLLSP